MDSGGTDLSELFADFSMQDKREIKERERTGIQRGLEMLAMSENEQAETWGCLQNTALAHALAPAVVLCCSYLFPPQINQWIQWEHAIKSAPWLPQDEPLPPPAFLILEISMEQFKPSKQIWELEWAPWGGGSWRMINRDGAGRTLQKHCCLAGLGHLSDPADPFFFGPNTQHGKLLPLKDSGKDPGVGSSWATAPIFCGREVETQRLTKEAACEEGGTVETQLLELAFAWFSSQIHQIQPSESCAHVFLASGKSCLLSSVLPDLMWESGVTVAVASPRGWNCIMAPP